MTAPDPTPYAAPGDLVTAEDAARWLREHIREGRSYTYEAADALDARLDRERRQSCRRGALDCWRRVAEYVRWCHSCSDTRVSHHAQWAWDECGSAVSHYLTRALAFRAAARAK